MILMASLLSSCSVFAPNVSKAQTEQKQLAEEKQQTALETKQLDAIEKQNVILERIAVALEKATMNSGG